MYGNVIIGVPGRYTSHLKPNCPKEGDSGGRCITGEGKCTTSNPTRIPYKLTYLSYLHDSYADPEQRPCDEQYHQSPHLEHHEPSVGPPYHHDPTYYSYHESCLYAL